METEQRDDKSSPLGRAGVKLKRFFLSPLDSGLASPLRFVGDWMALVGIILYFICVFASPWIKLRVSVLGFEVVTQQFGLFESPWAWALVAFGVVLIGGFWFVQTRGLVTFAVGILGIIFAVVFWIGVWKKIESIIGPIVRLARTLPLVGEFIAAVTKEAVGVSVSWGYVLFIVTSCILMAGGLLRYFLVSESA